MMILLCLTTFCEFFFEC